MKSKILHSIFFTLTCFLFYAQDEDKVWEKEKDLLKYEKKEKYKGPNDWYGSYPSNMDEEDIFSGNSSGSSGGTYGGGRIQYNPQQLQRDRDKRYNGFERGGGDGTLPYDPEVKRPDPIDVPDVDAPDIDIPTPDIDIDPPMIPAIVWKILLFIVIFAALVYIAYIIVKNRRPSDKKVLIDVEDDWNPEVITKTELELKLEEAAMRGDYRECVRIYFTFILKELITKGWIRWKKEKTNHDYVLELAGKPESFGFIQAVRIYDLVWYGEYQIDEEVYELLRPELENYYKSLNPKDE